MPESSGNGSGWVRVSVAPDPSQAVARERCMAALFESGAQGVHEDKTALITHFPPGTNVQQVLESLERADPKAAVETGPVPDIDWREAWKTRITAQEAGGLVVAPPWLAGASDPARTIVIEPGMAFGTGDHATTRGMLRLMARHLKPGMQVADLGAGSAVLSIAAARMGASRVYGVELDPDAIPDAERNVERNMMRNDGSGSVHIFEGDASVILPLLAPVNCVLANIISSVLLGLLPVIALALAPDGVVILSGILASERDGMLQAFESGGWRVTDEDSEDVWWSVSIARG